MSRTDWPKQCSISDAARLFADERVTVDRSNLSRFISTRKIPTTEQGGKRLVDPNVLFEAYTKDFGRAVMAGETGGAAKPAPQPASQPAPAVLADDPRRDMARLQAKRLAMEMAQDEGRLVPAEEVAAAVAESIADLRAAFAEAANDAADALMQQLGLPVHRHAHVVAAFKTFARLGQEKFAARYAAALDASTPVGLATAERLEKLVALDLDLRGEGVAPDEEPPAEPAPPLEPALQDK